MAESLEQAIKKIELWRDWKRNEETLISFRLAWLVGINGFLAASFAIIGGYERDLFKLAYSVIIGAAGIAVCWFSFWPINAALETIEKIRIKLDKYRNDEKYSSNYFFEKRPGQFHEKSWMFAKQIPTTVIVMWLTLIAVRVAEIIHAFWPQVSSFISELL